MKSRWKSKTYWLNLASLLIATMAANVPAMQGTLSPTAFAWWTMGLAVANIVLRELGQEELTPLRKPKDER